MVEKCATPGRLFRTRLIMISLSSTTSLPIHERDARTHACLAQAADASGRAERQRLLDEAVLLNLDFADGLARQYDNRGIPLDDLIQVARLGLVAAANRYDPSRGCGFVGFAMPTIKGELRKYFRDTGWSIRPPRRLQEANARIRQVTAELTQVLGRTPTNKELAEALDCEEHLVAEARVASSGYRNLSLDHETNVDGDAETVTLADALGDLDPGFSRAEARIMLAPSVERLGERERRVLELRFVEGLTQREVGERIGVSQMQVSRILAGIISMLRDELGVTAAA